VTGVQAGYVSRDSQEVEALVADRYLESILAAHGRGADHGPTPAFGRLDPGVRWAIERLARDLPRLHPSFRFEEALASKLSDAAARMGRPVELAADDVIVRLHDRGLLLPIAVADRTDPGSAFGDPRLSVGRPLLIGGALTSAALSIAGAAYVAWRIRHPQTSPMARAVRAVGRTRPA
jgi:hypothetical protein